MIVSLPYKELARWLRTDTPITTDQSLYYAMERYSDYLAREIIKRGYNISVYRVHVKLP
jgi:hypothetical protein